MFQVVDWPQWIFENRDLFDIQEVEEENGLEWHELSFSSRQYYEELSVRQVCCLMILMSEKGGTLQEFKSLDEEKRNSYCSDRDGMSSDSDEPIWNAWNLAGCNVEGIHWRRCHSDEGAGGMTPGMTDAVTVMGASEGQTPLLK